MNYKTKNRLKSIGKWLLIGVGALLLLNKLPVIIQKITGEQG